MIRSLELINKQKIIQLVSKSENLECYFCGNKATSEEHAPAECFFPKDERIGKVLIRVPSCNLHNQDTSNDDDYVRNIIVMSIGNDEIGKSLFSQKVAISFNRHKKVYNEMKATGFDFVLIKDGEIQINRAYTIDRQKVDKIIRKISYALFFYEFGISWNRELYVFTNAFTTLNFEFIDLSVFDLSFKSFNPQNEFKGEVPSVFKYCFIPNGCPDITNDKLLLMIFYNEIEIWVNAKENSKGPSFDLT